MSVSRTLAADGTVSADLDLVDRHRYGDGAAFEEIYQLHSSMVYALCVRMSGDPAAAQDLSQEVFLRIFRSLGGFRGRSSLRTWIYRITLNHCRSRLGRKRLDLNANPGPRRPSRCSLGMSGSAAPTRRGAGEGRYSGAHA